MIDSAPKSNGWGQQRSAIELGPLPSAVECAPSRNPWLQTNASQREETPAPPPSGGRSGGGPPWPSRSPDAGPGQTSRRTGSNRSPDRVPFAADQVKWVAGPGPTDFRSPNRRGHRQPPVPLGNGRPSVPIVALRGRRYTAAPARRRRCPSHHGHPARSTCRGWRGSCGCRRRPSWPSPGRSNGPSSPARRRP